MPKLLFVTGNPEKFASASHTCQEFGIELEQVVVDIDEIQGEEPEPIIKHKALAAYELVGQPVIVSDDTWAITALNGFPGAYMKSINNWFTTDDFLRLMSGVTDRSMVLHQNLAYHDGHETIIFNHDLPGTILTEAHGNHTKTPWMNIATMHGDGGKSITEMFDPDNGQAFKRSSNVRQVWHEVAEWYKENHS